MRSRNRGITAIREAAVTGLRIDSKVVSPQISRGLRDLVLGVLFGRELARFDVAFHGTVAAVVFIGLIG